MLFHMGYYPKMYLKIPIIISNPLDFNYLDAHNLKFIEIYDKTETEAAVIRVKATFHVENPLSLGFKVPIFEFEDQWLPFLYENMPQICFQCGYLGHHLKECKVTVEHDEENAGNEIIYSPRMKISPRAPENR